MQTEKHGTVGTNRSYKNFSWSVQKYPNFKVKSLKREERQTTMLKGPDKFLEDAFNAADKKYALPEFMLNSFLFTLQ